MSSWLVAARPGPVRPEVADTVVGMTFERTLPAPLAELNAIEFDYADGDGIESLAR